MWGPTLHKDHRSLFVDLLFLKGATAKAQGTTAIALVEVWVQWVLIRGLHLHKITTDFAFNGPYLAVKAGWTPWSSWTTCSMSCGDGGFTTRSRTCLDDGSPCVGDNFDAGQCNMDPCPSMSVQSKQPFAS